MGQPTPPGDMPLFEGLGAEWNDVVSAFPEDRRAELAPLIKQRFDSALEPYKQWEDLNKSGITAEQASSALDIYKVIESNPRAVYDKLGEYLKLTPQQQQQVVDDMEDIIEDGDPEDPRIQRLQQQVDTMSQILIGQRQQTVAEQQKAEADKWLDDQISSLKKKYGDDVDEQQVVMRMMHMNMSAEEAYNDYTARDAAIRQRRPSPLLLGGSGGVPNSRIDVTKLDNRGARNLAAQMMEAAQRERG